MESSATDNQANDQIKPWVRQFARIGYFSKGIVYILIGLLAIAGALNIGGRITGTTGLFRSLATIPLGEILLWLIGIGLIGYIVWEIIRLFKNPYKLGHSMKDIFRRGLFAVTGIIYGHLAYTAFHIAWLTRTNAQSQESWLAQFLQTSVGQWTIGIAGLVIIGFGAYGIYKGLFGNFMEHFKTEEMNEREKKTTKTAGTIGLTARGLVFLLIGYFFIQTALNASRGTPGGLDRALSALAQQSHGPWLIGITAVGLMLYGFYEIIKGRYKYISLK